MTAAKRVEGIIIVIGKMINTVKDKDAQSLLKKRLSELKVMKAKKKLDLDTCKAVLIQSAVTLKKINKML